MKVEDKEMLMDEMMDVDDMKSGQKKKAMYTMDDVAKELEKDFGEEIDDAKRYMCMAKVAKKSGDEETAHYLSEIAKDEYTHARYIKGYMEDHDMDIPEEHTKAYSTLKEKMARFF